MYNAMYNCMIEAGIAIKYETEVMLDRHGNTTNDIK
jgi:hypothetical protein